MNLKGQFSPELIKLIMLSMGLSSAFLLWSGLAKVQANFQVAEVLGLASGDVSTAPQVVITTLPIVEASVSSANAVSAESDVSAELLEAAFKEPIPPEPEVPAEVPTEEKKPPEEPLLGKIVTMYRPAVNAVTDEGAFISGVFWRVGEEIKTMPIRNSKGEVVYPRFSRLSTAGVAITLDGAAHTLQFHRF